MAKARLPRMVLVPDRKPVETIRPGWEIEGYSFGVGPEPVVLSPVRFLRRCEERIDGQTMLRRGEYRKGHIAGQEHAQVLLNQQDQIPEAWQDNIALVFGGTVWIANVSRCREVPILYFDAGGEEKWLLDYASLDEPWEDEDYRLLRVHERK